MRHMFTSVLSLLLLQFVCPFVTFAGSNPDGRDIMVLVDERPDGDDRHSIISMTLINKHGRERKRKVESFSRDYDKDKKSVMIFKEPADVRDTIFLSWEYDDLGRDDDKWLYVPAMKKVRRISGATKREYFMGTDFTYDDMGNRKVDADRHRLLGEEKVMGFDCWQVESVPYDQDDIYTKLLLWVDKVSYVPVRIEFYDKDGLLKVYTAEDLRRQDGIWFVFRAQMDNVSRSHKTIMETSNLRLNTGLKDELFRVATIQRGRLN